MRDSIVARRALLALAAGSLVAAVWPATTTAAARSASRWRRLRQQHRIVALDPGHGGSDPGTISPHGVYEKAVNLATARELARQLAATGRYLPVLTRRGDVFVPLRERVERARAAQAEVFLSLHSDALPDTAMHGLAVYTLSEQASDREAAGLARRENRDDVVGGLRLSHQLREIADILRDLERRRTENQSLLLARAIVAALGRIVPLLEKPHRSAAFVVLTAPDIPSALVELGCLSNPRDERLLPTPVWQRRLALGLVRAIDDCFAAGAGAA
jgi:N-acetylmuramoyl-L-alanine amidase